MCDREHNYTVEVVGQPVRYIGTESEEAVSALCGIDIDGGEEGYAVAEHETETIDSNGPGTSYCRAESERIESEAIAARVDAERKWRDAYEAFHGEGPYAMANQDW